MDRAPHGDRPRGASRAANALRSSRSLHSSLARTPSTARISRSVSSSLSRSTSRKLLKSASFARATSKSLIRSASNSRLVRSASRSQLVRSESKLLGSGFSASTKTTKHHRNDNPWGVQPNNEVIPKTVTGLVPHKSPPVSPSKQIRTKWKSLGGTTSSTFHQMTPKRALTTVASERPKSNFQWRGAATFSGAQKNRKSESSSSSEGEIEFVVEEVPSFHDDEFLAFSTSANRPRERLRDIVRRIMAKKPPALRDADHSADVT